MYRCTCPSRLATASGDGCRVGERERERERDYRERERERERIGGASEQEWGHIEIILNLWQVYCVEQ